MTDKPAPPPTVQDAQAILDNEVGALLTGHLGSVTVTSVGQDGGVELAFGGTCDGCPVLPVTFTTVVEPALRRHRGVAHVSSPQMNVSAAAVRRIRALHDLPNPEEHVSTLPARA